MSRGWIIILGVPRWFLVSAPGSTLLQERFSWLIIMYKELQTCHRNPSKNINGRTIHIKLSLYLV